MAKFISRKNLQSPKATSFQFPEEHRIMASDKFKDRPRIHSLRQMNKRQPKISDQLTQMIMNLPVKKAAALQERDPVQPKLDSNPGSARKRQL
mmetsp:Transcript_2661/g.4473  ORF Transcript_2661/g.4473 Transcript_2661/m.4473 type:complete len:93 (-) Transcript_2661:152-430(-)